MKGSFKIDVHVLNLIVSKLISNYRSVDLLGLSRYRMLAVLSKTSPCQTHLVRSHSLVIQSED